MEKHPKDRTGINRVNKYIDEKDVFTLKADKAAETVPSLNKISKQTNPQ